MSYHPDCHFGEIKLSLGWATLGGGVEHLAMNEEVGIFICQLPIYHWLRAPLGVLAPLPEFTAMIVQDQVEEKKKKMPLGKLWQVLVVSSFMCTDQCQEDWLIY